MKALPHEFHLRGHVLGSLIYRHFFTFVLLLLLFCHDVCFSYRAYFHQLWTCRSVIGLNEVAFILKDKLCFTILSTIELNVWLDISRDLLIFSEVFQSLQNIILCQADTHGCIKREFSENIFVYVCGTINRFRNCYQKVSCLAILRGKCFEKYARIWRNPHRAFLVPIFEFDLSEVMETLVFFILILHFLVTNLTWDSLALCPRPLSLLRSLVLESYWQRNIGTFFRHC